MISEVPSESVPQQLWQLRSRSFSLNGQEEFYLGREQLRDVTVIRADAQRPRLDLETSFQKSLVLKLPYQ